MSGILRVVLLISALIMAVWILRKIYKCKVKMGDAIFWFFMATILAILGFFPTISYEMTALMGIQSPANFIFLVILFLLMEKIFTLSITLSKLEDKVTVLSAELALRSENTDKKIVSTKEEQHNENISEM